MSPKADAYNVVTDRIIEALEGGTVPWRKPWRSIAGQLPTSLQTGKEYRGINVWLLSLTAAANGYQSPYWATFKQAKERAVNAARAEGREIIERQGRKGSYFVEIVQSEDWENGQEVLFTGGVRKGERGTQVVLWKPIRKTAEESKTGKEERYLVLRYYTVFNAEQCDGVPTPELPEMPADHDPIASCESIVSGWTGRPEIKHGGNRAYYSPALDYIQMPISGAFDEAEGYYGTLFHELAHSTGHESRLGRKSLISPAPFGSEDYSKEELVAEMASAFICGEAGIEPRLEQSAAYIASWLRVLKDDRKLIVSAAAQAHKAADLVLGIEAAKGEGEEPSSVSHSTKGSHDRSPDRLQAEPRRPGEGLDGAATALRPRGNQAGGGRGLRGSAAPSPRDRGRPPLRLRAVGRSRGR